MMDFGGHMSTGGWILSILGVLTLVALFVALVIVVVSAIDARRAGTRAETESSREILDRLPRTSGSEIQDPVHAT